MNSIEAVLSSMVGSGSSPWRFCAAAVLDASAVVSRVSPSAMPRSVHFLVIAETGVVVACLIPILLMVRSSPGLVLPAILFFASVLVPASTCFLPVQGYLTFAGSSALTASATRPISSWVL